MPPTVQLQPAGRDEEEEEEEDAGQSPGSPLSGGRRAPADGRGREGGPAPRRPGAEPGAAPSRAPGNAGRGERSPRRVSGRAPPPGRPRTAPSPVSRPSGRPGRRRRERRDPGRQPRSPPPPPSGAARSPGLPAPDPPAPRTGPAALPGVRLGEPHHPTRGHQELGLFAVPPKGQDGDKCQGAGAAARCPSGGVVCLSRLSEPGHHKASIHSVSRFLRLPPGTGRRRAGCRELWSEPGLRPRPLLIGCRARARPAGRAVPGALTDPTPPSLASRRRPPANRRRPPPRVASHVAAKMAPAAAAEASPPASPGSGAGTPCRRGALEGGDAGRGAPGLQPPQRRGEARRPRPRERPAEARRPRDRVGPAPAPL
ncbi:collagen alpha-1(I) chain-like [Perognathus longimembris pacificus]|uniref:collagen alpha-1(I) chain-like n=1 Tax=Perognathus longimembris pacificus TaxID=214514 RepID=UPI002018D1E7|nr:collagen alpha-1(I) chain-like [Perognathus longimembris pacificus]